MQNMKAVRAVKQALAGKEIYCRHGYMMRLYCTYNWARLADNIASVAMMKSAWESCWACAWNIGTGNRS